MVPEPHGYLYIEIYFLIVLFQVTIYFQYVNDYFNAHLRCCVLCHYYMFYGRLRFYCILIVYAKFFWFILFLLYLVRNDNNKDDQSIIFDKWALIKNPLDLIKRYIRQNIHIYIPTNHNANCYSANNSKAQRGVTPINPWRQVLNISNFILAWPRKR